MSRLGSTEELAQLRARLQLSAAKTDKPRIVIAAGTACQASGANDIQRLFKRLIVERDLVDQVSLRITGDHGFCEMAPYVVTEPQNAFYAKVGPDDVPRILDALLNDTYVDDLLCEHPLTGERIRDRAEIPFFKLQHRTLLASNERVDPIRLNNYIAAGGYEALEKVLANPNPQQIIEEMKLSGMRGRGGAGFPTFRKWALANAQPSDRGKVVICNADEGDPGAYMDRGILEGNPHSIIEGMVIGAIAMGATDGVIYVRYEYPLAIKNTIIALRVAREHRLLGENILGSDFSFDIEIVKGAGAFVCGEETALIRSVEGFMGEPRQRPPFPIERGLHGKPTCINNVETWANVPGIIRHGGKAFAEIGTPESTGTKVFSLVGKIKNTGLVEVPMGTSIKKLVYDIGGGAPDNGRIKAVQTGGPSGGCIPKDRFDLPIDYDSLTEAGAIMGSGGMIVTDESTCMVDLAKYFMNFLRDESCGKCFTCRKGTQRLYEILEDITQGKGTLEQLDLLEELAGVVKDTSMCGLGQSAPNPVLSTLRYFRAEYERHIVDKRCDAFVCKDLVGAPCQSACPIGTEAWRYVAHIARGEVEEAYAAIRETNPFPSVCARVCDHKCEQHCRLGGMGQRSVAIRMLKRFVTDTVDPAKYEAPRDAAAPGKGHRIAIVGSGPAGLTAAHYLSLKGYQSVVFEADHRVGGMLRSGVPEYRLPRDVLDREIEALLDQNITLRCNTALGRDVTIDALLEEGFDAVFLALGAHRSRRLGLEGEDADGVTPSIQFLKTWNLRGNVLAKGKVGVIGGGNSAIDAARVALRQSEVESVTIYYRRTRNEMPAFAEEIDAALEEGIILETLVSPTKLDLEDGHLKGLELLRNDLGEVDASGRRRPVPAEGSEFRVDLDTLVVAIGEHTSPFDPKGSGGLEFDRGGAVMVNDVTLETRRKSVFAGGDVVTGPNTVVDAIAAGKRAATMIDRHVHGVPLVQPIAAQLPSTYVEAPAMSDEDGQRERAEAPAVAEQERVGSFVEVEKTLDHEQAMAEARRCLRCDLEFTKPAEKACEGCADTATSGEAHAAP